MADLVAIWDVPLCDKIHKVEFEHGTTTGKRIIRVDGKEILKRDWMFKLVGSEVFEIKGQDSNGKENDVRAKCEIVIVASSGFTYEYSLLVNGKQLKKFREKQTKVMKTWILETNEKKYRIALEKDTLDVWVNGEKVETNYEFADEGTEMNFLIDQEKAVIKTISSGNKKEGIVYVLIVNDKEIPESYL